MVEEFDDLDKLEIFYEEVGSADFISDLDFTDPQAFREEVEPSQGLSEEDVSQLSRDLNDQVQIRESTPDPSEDE